MAKRKFSTAKAKVKSLWRAHVSEGRKLIKLANSLGVANSLGRGKRLGIRKRGFKIIPLARMVKKRSGKTSYYWRAS